MLDKLANLLNSHKFLNWTRVAELGAVILILIAGLVFYENRQKVYDSVGANKFETYQAMVLSEKTKAKIDEVVHRVPIVLGLHVVEANFIKNERSTAYIKLDDYELEKGYKNYKANKISNPPIFSENEYNNHRIIRLINGEFVCLPMNETIAAQFGPAAQLNVGLICSISIPPVYGKFRGYLTAYVKKDYREIDLAQIKIMLLALSQEIYESDLR